MKNNDRIFLEHQIRILDEKFARICELERKAVNDKLYESDLGEFEKLCNLGTGISAELTEAKMKLVEVLCENPDLNQSIEALVNRDFGGEQARHVLKYLVNLKYWYQVNNVEIFEDVALKILRRSGGDLDSLVTLVQIAKRDWRDVE